jgi:hypothetical protein
MRTLAHTLLQHLAAPGMSAMNCLLLCNWLDTYTQASTNYLILRYTGTCTSTATTWHA